ncbi:MAG TPA: hypothetical protein DCQ50_08980 [Chryseobacterium sp.]|nr:hypothetical protein [Chryseobacterium sp.]
MLFYLAVKTTTMNNHDETIVVVRPLSQKKLAALYGVSTVVLRTWLKPFENITGKQKGHRYSLQQLLIIFSKLGYPNLKP